MKMPDLLRSHKKNNNPNDDEEDNVNEADFSSYQEQMRDEAEKNFRRINFSTFKAMGLKIFSLRTGATSLYKIGKSPPSVIWTEIKTLPGDCALELWRNGKVGTVRMMRNGSPIAYCETAMI